MKTILIMRVRISALLIALFFLSNAYPSVKDPLKIVGIAEDKIKVSSDSCLLYLGRAFEIFDSNDDLARRIRYASNIAGELDMAGYTAEALTLFNENTVDNLRRPPKDSAEWDLLAWLHTNLAYSYAYSVGDLDLAKENYEIAVQLFESKNLTIDEYVARYAYQELGNIYTQKGDFEAALIVLEKFKNISLGIGDFNAAAEAYSDMGTALYHFGKDSLSADCFLRGLDLQGIHINPKALLEGNLVNHYSRKKDLAEALIWVKNANASFEIIDQNGLHPESKIRLANNLKQWGEIESQRGNPEIAEAKFLRALNLMKAHYGKDTLRRETAKIHLGLGQFYLDFNQPNRALPYYQSALKCVLPGFNSDDFFINPNVEIFYSENVILDALEGKADAFFELYQTKNDRRFLEKSLDCQDLIFEAENIYRRVHRFRSSKLEIIEGSRTRSENAIKTALKFAEDFDDFSQKEKAFSFAEKSKSVLLFEALKHSNAKSVANIPESILNSENALNEQITYLEKELFSLKNSGNLSRKSTDSLENELLRVRKDYNELIIEIERDYPAYHNLKYGQSELKIEQIRNDLRTDEALIEYFVGEENIFIFLISKEVYEVIQIEKDFPLEAWVNQFRKDIEQFQFEQSQALCESYSEQAFELYKYLITPIEKFDLPENLIIIPSDILNFLPFDALLKSPAENLCNFKTYDYLINHHNVVYNYSATLWSELNFRKRSRAGKKIIGFAPLFPENNSSGFGELKYNIPTLKAVKNLIGGDIFTDKDGNRIQFEKHAEDYKIIHFATHAKANSTEGDFSFIVLAKPEGGYDTLFVKDIYNRKLLAELVFLGACETGNGKLRSGEGVISLARSFLYAGANSVLTTLWSVNDQMTKNMAVGFYENLKAGLRKDEALRTVKLSHITNEKLHPHYSHPVFWAAYTPVGNMRRVFGNNLVIYGIFGLCLLIFGLVWRFRRIS